MIGLAAIGLSAVLVGAGSDHGEPAAAEGGRSKPTVADKPAPGLAVLQITTSPEGLFDPQRGIYFNPTNRGAAWERPASVELLSSDGTSVFRARCGLRIHGGSSRQPGACPKHSFRLVFKGRYGEGDLQYPMFGPGSARPFQSLVLRAGYNDSWLDPDPRSRRRASYLRDEWMRESMSAMGYPSAKGIFVELYLNGQYWGLYNLCERPDASFVASHEGGSPKDYDCRKASEVISGDGLAWEKLLALADAGLADPAAFAEVARRVNLIEFADYMILNFYAGNSDWDRHSNWYASRRRTEAGRFEFFVWDAECTLGGLDACTIDFKDDESPPGLFHQLCESAEFRRLFARRAEHLLLGDGPLSAESCQARYEALARKVEHAVGHEAARWGGHRAEKSSVSGGAVAGRELERQWQQEVNRVLNDYFPHRTEVVLNQLRERGLYPTEAHAAVERTAKE